jgi:hypothetical protein
VNFLQTQVPSKVDGSLSGPVSFSPLCSAIVDSLLSQHHALNSKKQAQYKLKEMIQNSKLPAAGPGESVHATALPSETKMSASAVS